MFTAYIIEIVIRDKEVGMSACVEKFFNYVTELEELNEAHKAQVDRLLTIIEKQNSLIEVQEETIAILKKGRES